MIKKNQYFVPSGKDESSFATFSLYETKFTASNENRQVVSNCKSACWR